MPKEFKRILVTAALPYANGPLHLGHLAGAYLPSDLYCRFKRLQGKDVVYICGSDENGVPIMLKARAEGVEPQVVVDRYHAIIEKAFEDFGMSFDYYGRTSSSVHQETSQEFFKTLAEKDAFVLNTNEQLFDPKAHMFLADRFVRGECPHCGYQDAYGDQCENCGTSLSPDDLINPRSAVTDAIPVKKETTHWYLPLAKVQPKLEAWIDSHPEWKKNVLGQIRSWFNDGLADRAVTRDLSWGVPIPKEVAEKAHISPEGKVLYVWFDAPIGYISATREWARQQGNPELWKTYWQDDETQLLHFIGKDNIVFHCIIFPAMLMEHGNYVLPENVPANEFLNLEGQKLSTSRGWAVWLHEYLEIFPPDLLRYTMASIFPETKDADFSWKDFQARVNSELADILGNFVNRTLTFCERYFDGKVPNLENPQAVDLEVLAQLSEFPQRIAQSYDTFRFREAVAETMNLARMGNKYFNDTEPWHTRKNNPEACANTIHVSLQLCASLSVLMEPILPFSASKLRQMLNLQKVKSSTPTKQNEEGIGWEDAGVSLLSEGHEIGTAEILFNKLDDDLIDAQIEKLERTAEAIANAKTPTEKPYMNLKDEIEFEDFIKLDFRVGTIIEADTVPKADKLLIVTVDLGFEKRQVLAGIALQYKPEELIGKKVVMVINLKPRKMRGLESQGMLLMAEDRNGNLVPVQASSENGSVVR